LAEHPLYSLVQLPSEAMKILWIPHLAWPELDGQRERRLLSGWPDQGDEIHVLTWRPVRGFGRALDSLRPLTFRDGRVVVHSLPRLPNVLGRVSDNYAHGLWANEQLFRFYARRLVREHRIDVLIYGLGHKLIGLPPFDIPVFRVFDYLDLCTYPEAEAAYLANSDLVICTSSVLAERVRRLGGRSVHIPNGVDTAAMSRGRRTQTRLKLGLEGKKVVSLIGLTYGASLFFVDAIAIAARTIPELVLLLVGGGVAKGDLVRPIVDRCRQLGVPVVTTGRVPSNAVADYFAASDVGLYPGASDAYFDAACPIKVLEYTAAGRPVVATDLEELRRMAFENVWLSAAEPEPFAAALVAAISEQTSFPDLRRFDWKALATQARDECLQMFRARRSRDL
jgi:glycosyltransferase involved in cell wall biosynthesis